MDIKLIHQGSCSSTLPVSPRHHLHICHSSFHSINIFPLSSPQHGSPYQQTNPFAHLCKGERPLPPSRRTPRAAGRGQGRRGGQPPLPPYTRAPLKKSAQSPVPPVDGVLRKPQSVRVFSPTKGSSRFRPRMIAETQNKQLTLGTRAGCSLPGKCPLRGFLGGSFTFVALMTLCACCDSIVSGRF